MAAKAKAKSKVTYRAITPELVREELAAFEHRYGMKSSEFLKRYYAGELHEHDAMSWEFACDMAKELGVEFE